MKLELQATERGRESLTIDDMINLEKDLRSMDGITEVKPVGLGRIKLDIEPSVSVSAIIQFVQTRHGDLLKVVEEAQ